MQSVSVFAPATVGNLVCGFDVLGFALEHPGDKVRMELNDSGRVSLDLVEGDKGRLPREPEKNIVSAVVNNFLKYIGTNQGVGIRLYKQMPFGSGLGSSAASAVAGLVAINELMGQPLSREELLPLAIDGERLSSGSAHADNVAPSLLGGIVLVRGKNLNDAVKLPFPRDLVCALVYPHIEVSTRLAREIIPENIMLKDAIRQWGNIAGLVAGLCTSDKALIGRSMEDVVAEPLRSGLIPGFNCMREIALENGAIGFGISGSGPTVFALCDDKARARSLAGLLRQSLDERGIVSSTFISDINNEGAVVLSGKPHMV